MIPHPVNPIQLPRLGDERAAYMWFSKETNLSDLVLPIPDTGGKVFTLALDYLRSEAEEDYDTWANAQAKQNEISHDTWAGKEHTNIELVHETHQHHTQSAGKYILSEHDLIAMLSIPETYKNTRLLQAIIVHPLLPRYAYLKLAEAVDHALTGAKTTEPALPLPSMIDVTGLVDFLYYAEQSPTLPLNVHERFLRILPGSCSSAASGISNSPPDSRWVDMVLAATERDARNIYDYVERHKNDTRITPYAFQIDVGVDDYLTVASVFYAVEKYVSVVRRDQSYRTKLRDDHALQALLWIARTPGIAQSSEVLDVVASGHFAGSDDEVLHEITSLCLVLVATH